MNAVGTFFMYLGLLRSLMFQLKHETAEDLGTKVLVSMHPHIKTAFHAIIIGNGRERLSKTLPHPHYSLIPKPLPFPR